MLRILGIQATSTLTVLPDWGALFGTLGALLFLCIVVSSLLAVFRLNFWVFPGAPDAEKKRCRLISPEVDNSCKTFSAANLCASRPFPARSPAAYMSRSGFRSQLREHAWLHHELCIFQQRYTRIPRVPADETDLVRQEGCPFFALSELQEEAISAQKHNFGTLAKTMRLLMLRKDGLLDFVSETRVAAEHPTESYIQEVLSTQDQRLPERSDSICSTESDNEKPYLHDEASDTLASAIRELGRLLQDELDLGKRRALLDRFRKQIHELDTPYTDHLASLQDTKLETLEEAVSCQCGELSQERARCLEVAYTVAIDAYKQIEPLLNPQLGEAVMLGAYADFARNINLARNVLEAMRYVPKKEARLGASLLRLEEKFFPDFVQAAQESEHSRITVQFEAERQTQIEESTLNYFTRKQELGNAVDHACSRWFGALLKRHGCDNDLLEAKQKLFREQELSFLARDREEGLLGVESLLLSVKAFVQVMEEAEKAAARAFTDFTKKLEIITKLDTAKQIIIEGTRASRAFTRSLEEAEKILQRRIKEEGVRLSHQMQKKTMLLHAKHSKEWTEKIAEQKGKVKSKREQLEA
eukprot:XP_028343985.1 uncharacterized protein LOC114486062 [Physeter catodon]